MDVNRAKGRDEHKRVRAVQFLKNTDHGQLETSAAFSSGAENPECSVEHTPLFAKACNRI
jgi:hypothetical protein